MTSNEVIKPPELGCYVDGRWGQYGPARVIQIACNYGYDDTFLIAANRKLNQMGGNSNYKNYITDNKEEHLIWVSEQAEQWLNENVSDPNHSWGWHDGEFFYQSTEWWAED